MQTAVTCQPLSGRNSGGLPCGKVVAAQQVREHVHEAVREKAECSRSVEGMERERACWRQDSGSLEVGAGECGVGAEVEHETSGVCRTGASVMGAMVVSCGSPIPRIKPGRMLSSI